MSGDCLRRCARSIPRSDGAVSDRRTVSRHQLLVHGRLRGSWLLQRGNSDFAGGPEGKEFNILYHTAVLTFISLYFRCDTVSESQFCAATTSPAKSPKSTASTTSACANMAILTCGSSSRTCLTTCHWRLWLTARFSACTAASVRPSTP